MISLGTVTSEVVTSVVTVGGGLSSGALAKGIDSSC